MQNHVPLVGRQTHGGQQIPGQVVPPDQIEFAAHHGGQPFDQPDRHIGVRYDFVAVKRIAGAPHDIDREPRELVALEADQNGRSG